MSPLPRQPQPSSDGERRSASGLYHQYGAAGERVVEALQEGAFEEVRVTDPAAGQVDDVQIFRESRVDAYQIKWEQYPGWITLGDVVTPRRNARPLFAQLADGWRRLQQEHPTRRVVVHLLTNAVPSPGGPVTENSAVAGPRHFAAFLAQQWHPAHAGDRVDANGPWAEVWDKIQSATGLDDSAFPSFVRDCALDLATPPPPSDPDIDAIAALLFKTAASAKRTVRLPRADLFAQLGWRTRYAYRNRHEFDVPRFYQPIEETVGRLERCLDTLPGGYVAVVGPPGSGKSTLLTRTLRRLPVRLVRYYAFVREAGDPTSLRGESANFLHDVTLRFHEAGMGARGPRPDPGDRPALVRLLHEQLAALGEDARTSGTQTVLLVDGLDHIEREQHPGRSLLHDLPLPGALPDGVFVVLGSQRVDLSGLPSAVRHAVSTPDRRIDVGRLSPAAVDAILRETVPDLGQNERTVLADRSGGHPLALIYLVKQIQQATSPAERKQLVDAAVSYNGDIEAYYHPHWDAIDDAGLEHALALLARTRGTIDMPWATSWMAPHVSRTLDRSFGPYFDRDAAGGWTFFHNSFRLFLQARTGEPTLGLAAADHERGLHEELACHYGSRPDALYHLVEAEEHVRAVALASSDWFLAQARALRPLDAVRADVALAARAASAADDPLALTRLMLLAADLEQRSFFVSEYPVPERLVDLDESDLAVEAARDGDRLRIEPEEALALAVRLADVGSQRQAARLFELAEPYELFSGRPVDERRVGKHKELLGAWAEAAPRFRTAADVIGKVAGVRHAGNRYAAPEGDGAEAAADAASANVQRWLLVRLAGAAEARGDRAGWGRYLRALVRLGNGGTFDLLLTSAYAALDGSDRQRKLLDALTRRFTPLADGTNLEDVDRHLDLAERVFAHAPETADAWTQPLVPSPLARRDPRTEASPLLRRFRLYRLRYALGEPREPDALVQADAEATQWNTYDGPEDRAEVQRLARATTTLASLWGRGRRGDRLPPVSFVREASWILDAYGTRRSAAGGLRWEHQAARPELMEFAVEAAAQHGPDVLGAVTDAFERRWDRGDGTPALQRRVARALADADALALAQRVARRAAQHAPEANPRGRTEARWDQASTWLAVGDAIAARAELTGMVDAARGVLDDHDEQLEVWTRWMGRANDADPAGAEARIRTMLRRLVAVHGDASGVRDGAEALVRAAVRWSPRRAVALVQSLQLHRVIDHRTAFSAFLQEVAQGTSPPATAAFHAALRLLVPLGPPGTSALVPALLSAVARVHGEADALRAARHLAECARTSAISADRPGWLRGAARGLRDLGLDPAAAGISEAETVDPDKTSPSDPSLQLTDGRSLTLAQARAELASPGGFRALVALESPDSRFYSWHRLAEAAVDGVTSLAGLDDLARDVEERLDGRQAALVLARLSSTARTLGAPARADALATQALAQSEPTGWDPWMDGGSRLAALEALREGHVDHGRAVAANRFAQDLGTIGPHRLVHHTERIVPLFFDTLPVLDLWTLFEQHLNGLFGSTPVYPLPDVEPALAAPMDDDTPARAIADLVAFYLDHPSYSVAARAAEAAVAMLASDPESPDALGALVDAGGRSEEALRRVLTVLEAVYVPTGSLPGPVKAFLDTLRGHLDLFVRHDAAQVEARVLGQPLGLVQRGKDLPSVYGLVLPALSHHHTGRESAGALVDDPARVLRPYDIHARGLAEAAGVDEDAVLVRAANLARGFAVGRPWSLDDAPRTPEHLSSLLRSAHLLVAHAKPHIVPAERALGHAAGELWDAGRLAPRDVLLFAEALSYADADVLRDQPVVRPSWIPLLDNDTPDSSRVPDSWVEQPERSVGLLQSRSPDGLVVLGEVTRARTLGTEPQMGENRFSVVLPTSRKIPGLEADQDRTPFFEVRNLAVRAYLGGRAPAGRLVIHPVAFGALSPGMDWIAVDPGLASDLGWTHTPSGRFRWLHSDGSVAVETLWWTDGPLDRYDDRARCVVGEGWLVLASTRALAQIEERHGPLRRDALVRRQLGQIGSEGRSEVRRSLGPV